MRNRKENGMDAIKLRVESTRENEQQIEIECKSCICIAFDPLDVDADMIQTMTGSGDPRTMIVKAAESLWHLAGMAVNDETEKTIIGALMINRLKKAMLGESSLSGVD